MSKVISEAVSKNKAKVFLPKTIIKLWAPYMDAVDSVCPGQSVQKLLYKKPLLFIPRMDSPSPKTISSSASSIDQSKGHLLLKVPKGNSSDSS